VLPAAAREAEERDVADEGQEGGHQQHLADDRPFSSMIRPPRSGPTK